MTRSLMAMVLLLTSACSNMLYYPHDGQIYDPKDVGLEPEDVWHSVGNGEKIHSWYFKAEDPAGLVVFFHGNGENLSSHFASLRWLPEMGYSFLIFDYRGYWQSQGKPSPKSTVEDGISILKWGERKAKKLGVPLIVVGQSLGGAVSMRSLIDSGIRPSLVVIDSSFASYQNAGSIVLKKTKILWPVHWLSYILLSDQYAPGERISEISPTPMIFIHGDADRQVDIALGEEAYSYAGEPKEFWKITGGMHIDSMWREAGRWRVKLLEKFDAITGTKRPEGNP